MKFQLLSILFLIAPTSIVLAQDFTVNDERLGDSAINYVNPEIW